MTLSNYIAIGLLIFIVAGLVFLNIRKDKK